MPTEREFRPLAEAPPPTSDPVGCYRLLVQCAACDGAGYTEHYDGGYDPRDGSPTGYREPCRYCDGTGDEEIEAEPVTLDDLDDLYSTEDRGFA